ncbi:hypothetical protein [Pseudonocardia sp. HH130630-07]|uniref:hypothetical protein n=1 Tax=Pseudonocardia sp. HH130630-07 TaxID=1690815 RepID=UPI0008150CF6|nr:hypothetical protein [Pseudonocardia sp. HH130630-07]ANY07795.1 hypothetical protein AFB00_17510 [Pseudonocardia sp. HH130630-07]
MAGRTRAGSTRARANETTADESTVNESTVNESTTPDSSAPEDTATGEAVTGEAVTGEAVTGEAVTEEAVTEEAVTEEAEAPPEEALLEGAEPTWEEALPLIAIMAGGSTSQSEARTAITIWRMLRATNDAGTGPTAMQLAAEAELAGAVGIDGAVVSRILHRYQSAGMARTEDMNGIARWHYTTPRQVFAKAATARIPVSGRTRPAATDSVTHSVSVTQGESLPRGAITDMIDAYIHEHADRDFGPGEIGEVFSRRYGTTRGALDSLVARGRAVQLDTPTLRYQAA